MFPCFENLQLFLSVCLYMLLFRYIVRMMRFPPLTIWPIWSFILSSGIGSC